MKIYLATWNEASQNEALTKREGNSRLLSYFFIRDVDKFLKKYFNDIIRISKIKKEIV